MIKVGQLWDKNKEDTLRGLVCVTHIYYYSKPAAGSAHLEGFIIAR